jgi:YhcH/YjgK/YiaL family protein
LTLTLENALSRLQVKDREAIINFLENRKWNRVPNGFTALSDNVGLVKLDMEQPIKLADKLEYHRKKIDIHYIYSGLDQIQLKLTSACTEEFKAYDLHDDYGLYSDQATKILFLKKNDAIYLGPEMAHMALCGKGPVQKVVFKVNSNA